jgi:hypothetical protein
MKGLEGPHLSILVTFLCKKVSIALQRMQDVYILSWTIILGLTTSQLPPPHDTPPITMTDLLQEIDFLTWRNTADLLQVIGFLHEGF